MSRRYQTAQFRTDLFGRMLRLVSLQAEKEGQAAVRMFVIL